MKKEIISEESIKPSSPTPNNLRTHKLSLLDQIVPPIFSPVVLYYPTLFSENTIKSHKYSSFDEYLSQTTQLLKQSLSKTLTHYYPLAGRIGDKLTIDCNDEGVPFSVIKFKHHLSGFLKNPDLLACRNHIPGDLSWVEPGPGTPVAVIQVNFFECGGVAIGVVFYHKVMDGIVLGNFLKSWAQIAKGDALEEFPDYTPQVLFPHNETMDREIHLFSAMRKYFKVAKAKTRRYVFDAHAISKLRALHAQEINKNIKNRQPSRVEIVSAYIWKCYLSAIKKIDSSDDKISLVTHAVNLRRKAKPESSVTDHSFGNFVWLLPASTSIIDLDQTSLNHLVTSVRNSINKLNDDADFVTRMQGEQGFSGYLKNLEETWSELHDDADYLCINSWCSFGLHSVDFGFGQPVWISKCDAGSGDDEVPMLNSLWLTDTKDGDSVEAWLTLEDKYIDEIDETKDITELARVDPSPLDPAKTNY